MAQRLRSEDPVACRVSVLMRLECQFGICAERSVGASAYGKGIPSMTNYSSPKTGAEHIETLRDGRIFHLDGVEIKDHVNHPAFQNVVRVGAALYDYAAKPENIDLMTFKSPTSGTST